MNRIEEARFKKKEEMGMRHTVSLGTKGTREMRNLISIVNYDGRQLGY